MRKPPNVTHEVERYVVGNVRLQVSFDHLTRNSTQFSHDLIARCVPPAPKLAVGIQVIVNAFEWTIAGDANLANSFLRSRATPGGCVIKVERHELGSAVYACNWLDISYLHPRPGLTGHQPKLQRHHAAGNRHWRIQRRPYHLFPFAAARWALHRIRYVTIRRIKPTGSGRSSGNCNVPLPPPYADSASRNSATPRGAG